MVNYPRNLAGVLPAILLIACGSIGMRLRAAQVNLSRIQADRELEIYAKARTVVDMTVDELRRDLPGECRDLDFDENQVELPQLLQKTGESVAALVRDMPNTSSKEQVHRERLRNDGRVDGTSNQNYNYLVLPGKAGFWTETRTDSKGRLLSLESTTGSFILTWGFAGLAIIFHPEYQGDFRYRLLGRQNAESNPCVIAFAQKPEGRRQIGLFETPLSLTPANIKYQGLAWVDPQTHQILRMRTDLLAPRIDMLLARQTTEIWFNEVRFNDVPHAFWLPREVLVTMVWSGQTYRNRHRYSEFVVFSVQSLDKLEQLKVKK
jgi:hypothetical protein